MNLSESSVRRLSNTTRYVERASRSKPPQQGRGPLIQPNLGLIVTMDADIPAISGKKPGKAKATVVHYQSDGTLKASNTKIDVYNWTNSVFSIKTYVGVSRFGGKWAPTVWGCH